MENKRERERENNLLEVKRYELKLKKKVEDLYSSRKFC